MIRQVIGDLKILGRVTAHTQLLVRPFQATDVTREDSTNLLRHMRGAPAAGRCEFKVYNPRGEEPCHA